MTTWDEVDLDGLAQAWMAELGGSKSPDDIALRVVEMNFFASAETQWRFLVAAVAAAQNDDHLGHLAAGPLEHLLGHHGHYIEFVEAQSAADPRFARMTTGAWQNQMADDVWKRLQRIRDDIADPL